MINILAQNLTLITKLCQKKRSTRNVMESERRRTRKRRVNP